MVVKQLKGTAMLNIYGQREIARYMYIKGRNFIAAARLLRIHNGYEYVVLHLLCQGMENILKSFLLFKDYRKYRNRIKRNFGHDLEKLATTATGEFDVKPIQPALSEQLKELNSLYADHLLRYGSTQDIFFQPEFIKNDLVWRKIAAVVRLAERHVTN